MSKNPLMIAFILSMVMGASMTAEGARKAGSKKDKVAAELPEKVRQPAVEEGDAALREAIGAAKLIADTGAVTASETAAAVLAGANGGETALAAEASTSAAGAGEYVDTAVGMGKTPTAGVVATGADAAVEAGLEAGVEADIESGPAGRKDVSKLPEADIPVLETKEKTAISQSNTVQRVLLSLGVLLALLTATTLVLRRWSQRSQTRGQNPKIKILTQHHLGPKKSVAILQVAGESLLVGITDHSISMLKTLSLLDEEIPENTPRDFSVAMSDVDGDDDADDDDDDDFDMAGRAKRKRRRSAARDADAFAMRGLAEIRDTVTRRLRGTREQ